MESASSWAVHLFVLNAGWAGKARAFLMCEAVRNGDCLSPPSSGLLPGERALQQALNNDMAATLPARSRHEAESWQRPVCLPTKSAKSLRLPSPASARLTLRNPDQEANTRKAFRRFTTPASRLPSWIATASSAQLPGSRRRTLLLSLSLESIMATSILTSIATFSSPRMLLRPPATCCDRYSSIFYQECHRSPRQRHRRPHEPKRSVLSQLFSVNAPHPADVAREIFHPSPPPNHPAQVSDFPLCQMLMMQNIELGLCRHFHLRLPCNILPGKQKD